MFKRGNVRWATDEQKIELKRKAGDSLPKPLTHRQAQFAIGHGAMLRAMWRSFFEHIASGHSVIVWFDPSETAEQLMASLVSVDFDWFRVWMLGNRRRVRQVEVQETGGPVEQEIVLYRVTKDTDASGGAKELKRAGLRPATFEESLRYCRSMVGAGLVGDVLPLGDLWVRDGAPDAENEVIVIMFRESACVYLGRSVQDTIRAGDYLLGLPV